MMRITESLSLSYFQEWGDQDSWNSFQPRSEAFLDILKSLETILTEICVRTFKIKVLDEKVRDYRATSQFHPRTSYSTPE